MKKREKKGISFLWTLILIAFVPILASSIIYTVYTSIAMKNSLEDTTYQRLKVAAEGLDMYYTKDIVNKVEATYEHDYVDNLKEQNIEQTLFLENKRFITSIVDVKTGKRNEGTTMDDKIYLSLIHI